MSAKQAGLNIGILSALIQAGALSGGDCSRSLLVLVAQSFNLLTDREKRNVMLLGKKYDYKLLDIIVAAKEGLIGDDGKPLMKESRFQTFKKKYEKYKEIYLQNKTFEKFANWYFENKIVISIGEKIKHKLPRYQFMGLIKILNSDYLNMLAKKIKGVHNFLSFCKYREDIKSTECII